MPTVIESLVIELGLDPKKFTQGQKDALENFKRGQDQAISFGKNIEREGQRVGDVFAKLKGEALGLVTVFLGGKGIKDFVGYVTSLDAATGRAAYSLNMGARELSAWEGASAQLGGQVGGITAAMQGLSGSMNQFMLTGQGPFLAVMTHLGVSLFDQNNKLKTASQMFLEIADAVHKLNESDPARAAATLAMIPGANQDSINLMLKGRSALEGLLIESRKAGGTTFESAEAAAEYQKQLALLDRSATSLGRSLVTMLAPGLIAVANAMTRLLNAWRQEPGSPGDAQTGAKNRAGMNKLLGDPKDVWRFMNSINPWGVSEDQLNKELDVFYGPGTAAERDKKALADAALSVAARDQKNAGPPGQPATSLAEQEAYIRAAALKRGIDPDVAVAVARSEGLNKNVIGPGQQSAVVNGKGQREDSWGPFQLFMGGGLGNKFQKDTGNSPRDPSTWKQQVDFSLDEALKGGWGPWHGWKGLPRAGLPAPGGAAGAASRGQRLGDAGSGGGSQTISIGKVEINTKATDAQGIANEIPESLRRSNWAASANYGQTG